MMAAAFLIATGGSFGLWRLLRGPSYLDRVLALDFLSIAGVGAAIIYFNIYKQAAALDFAILLGLVGFVTALYCCRTLMRASEVEGEQSI